MSASHIGFASRPHNPLVAGLAVAALAFVLAAGLAGCGAAGDAAQGHDQGAQPAATSAPDAAAADIETHGALGAFDAGTLGGGTFTQDDIAAHDVTALFFWSTTCGPCVNKLPTLASLAQRLPANIQVATVCFDGAANAARAQEAVDAAGFAGPTITATSKGLTQLANQVVFTPTTVFVASDGTVVGSVLVGAPANFETTFVDGVNLVLEWQGKEAVALEPAA